MSRLSRKRKNSNIISKTRLIFIGNIFLFILLILIVRLFYIQVVKYDFYNTEAIRQRQINIPVNSGRGIIYDRNFIPLTDRDKQKMVVIFPQHFIANEDNILLLQDITEKPYNELSNKIKILNQFLEFPLVKNWIGMIEIL